MTIYMTFSSVADADIEPVVEEAALPADDETLAQLAENAGLDSIDDPIRTYDLEIEGLTSLCPYVELASLHEANILATRLTQLQEYEVADVEAFAEQMRKEGTVLGGDELINLTYQLDSCVHAPGVSNVTELGNFIIENDMDSEILELPATMIELIDPASLGRRWYIGDKGVFTRYGYTEQLRCPKALPHPYVRSITSMEPSDDNKTVRVALSERQWQIVGDALRTWDTPTFVQDAVDVIRDKIRNSLQEQTMSMNSQQPSLGL